MVKSYAAWASPMYVGERVRNMCGQRVALNDALVVHAPAGGMRGAVRRPHRQVIGQGARPKSRAHMHVPGQRSRPTVPSEFRGREAIGHKVRAEPAIRLGNADSKQPFGMHVAEILYRKARFPVVSRRAWREHATAELPRLVDKLGLEWRQPEGVGRKDRRIKRLPLN